MCISVCAGPVDPVRKRWSQFKLSPGTESKLVLETKANVSLSEGTKQSKTNKCGDS